MATVTAHRSRSRGQTGLQPLLFTRPFIHVDRTLIASSPLNHGTTVFPMEFAIPALCSRLDKHGTYTARSGTDNVYNLFVRVYRRSQSDCTTLARSLFSLRSFQVDTQPDCT